MSHYIFYHGSITPQGMRNLETLVSKVAGKIDQEIVVCLCSGGGDVNAGIGAYNFFEDAAGSNYDLCFRRLRFNRRYHFSRRAKARRRICVHVYPSCRLVHRRVKERRDIRKYRAHLTSVPASPSMATGKNRSLLWHHQRAIPAGPTSERVLNCHRHCRYQNGRGRRFRSCQYPVAFVTSLRITQAPGRRYCPR